MRRPRTSPLQASLLIAAGTLAGLALLELGMRAAGSFLTRAHGPLGQDAGGVVVLCLGESTTAPTLPKDHSWPAQLPRLLDAAGAGRFTVVNEGFTGARTDELLTALPRLLAEDHPDVVVAMIGINDAQWYGTGSSRGLDSFRLYKVARYAYHEFVRHEEAPRPEAGAETQRAIARAVLERGLPLVLMQYPGLDVAGLKERFAGLPGPASFVDNKASFDRALAASRYERYFTDRFAGDWGHCTAAGDGLIAENAAKAVLAVVSRSARAGSSSYIARGRARTDFSDAPRGVFEDERRRQLADFRAAPSLESLGRLLALLRDKPGQALGPADRRLALRLLSDASTAADLRQTVDLDLSLGERTMALAALDRLAEKEPGRAEPLLDLAELALRLRDRPRALAALERARPLARETVFRRRLALDLQEAGRSRDAADLLESLARQDPSNARLQEDLGVSLSLAGDRARAQEALSRAVALEPALYSASLSLASIYASEGRYDRARAVYDDALARGPRGKIRKDLEKARAELRFR